MSLHNILPQGQYASYLTQTAENIRDIKKNIPEAELSKFEKFKDNPESYDAASREQKDRRAAAKFLLKSLIDKGAVSKAGVTSALGYNFYDLRGPTQLSYPLNVPFRNSLPRIGRVNDGVGTAAHWMATRNPGFAYAGVTEGNRAAITTPDQNSYTATYKEIGVEDQVSFTAEFSSEGFTDNLADEHLRGLHKLWLQEEALMLLGNSGTASGNNGFALGTPATPTIALNANTNGTITTGTSLSVAVVALTAMGNPLNTQYGYGAAPTVANGVTPSYTVTSPGTGTSLTVNGGSSAISAMSAVVLTTSGSKNATASVASIKGAFGYAWYVNSTDTSSPTLANAKLAAITQFPSLTILALPSAGNQAGNAAGLNADHSSNATDFDGLLTYAANTGGWTDMIGASLTSQKNGRVTEVENVLTSIWSNYQSGISAIWGSADACAALDQGIRYGGSTGSSYRFDYTRDAQNNLLGGFVVSGYQSRFSMNPSGADVIPIRIHPMMPAGTLYFDLNENPYPHSRVPFVRGMLVQRDYYSIEWPLVGRNFQFGTYCHEVLAHTLPWIPAVLTGIGPFVGS